MKNGETIPPKDRPFYAIAYEEYVESAKKCREWIEAQDYWQTGGGWKVLSNPLPVRTRPAKWRKRIVTVLSSLKKAAPAEAQEQYDAYKEADKHRYKTYIRKTQEGW